MYIVLLLHQLNCKKLGMMEIFIFVFLTRQKTFNLCQFPKWNSEFCSNLLAMQLHRWWAGCQKPNLNQIRFLFERLNIDIPAHFYKPQITYSYDTTAATMLKLYIYFLFMQDFNLACFQIRNNGFTDWTISFFFTLHWNLPGKKNVMINVYQ